MTSRCGHMRHVATILDGRVARRILEHMRMPTRAPPELPARDRPTAVLVGGRRVLPVLSAGFTSFDFFILMIHLALYTNLAPGS